MERARHEGDRTASVGGGETHPGPCGDGGRRVPQRAGTAKRSKEAPGLWLPLAGSDVLRTTGLATTHHVEASRRLKRKPVELCSVSGSASGTTYPTIWRFQVPRPPHRVAVVRVRPRTTGKPAIVSV